jgi:hypothetical protein
MPRDQRIHDEARRAVHDVARQYGERVATDFAQVQNHSCIFFEELTTTAVQAAREFAGLRVHRDGKILVSGGRGEKKLTRTKFSFRRKGLTIRFRNIELLACIGGSLLSIALVLACKGTDPMETNKPDNLKSPADDCSLYASANGKDQNSGRTTTSPKTFLGAAAATRPGSVVCVLSGTYSLSSSFKPPVSGTPSAWIEYKSYGDGPVNFVWTGPADGSDMVSMESVSFPSDPAYLEFRGFNLDGRGNAANGFKCRGSHHLRFIGNTISNTGGGGISTVLCDYLTVDHNLVHHNGYRFGWTSGVSFNSNQWFDSYPATGPMRMNPHTHRRRWSSIMSFMETLAGASKPIPSRISGL